MKAPMIPWRRRRQPARNDTPLGLEEWMRGLFHDGDPWMRGWLDQVQFPAAEVAESDDDYTVSLELPGMKEEDVDVRIVGDHLVISGERKRETEKKKRHFHRREFEYGSFERAFELPSDVPRDAESVTATFRKGILEIHMKKVEPRNSAPIPVRSAD